MIITFYSHKGAVGRTMALANVACVLAQAGIEVVMIDWDLDAPGLEHFFALPPAELSHGKATFDIPLDQLTLHPGLLDFLHSHVWRAEQGHGPRSLTQQRAGSEGAAHPLERYMQPMTHPSFQGKLSLMHVGSRETNDLASHSARIRQVDWPNVYKQWQDEGLFVWLRNELEGPDRSRIVLIDCHTGVNEFDDICIRQLADIVVLFCAPTHQSIIGTHQVAKRILAMQRDTEHHSPKLLVLPARVDQTEHASQQSFSRLFAKAFAEMPTDFDHRFAFELTIPYVPRFSYYERIAVLDTPPSVQIEQQMAHTYMQIALMICFWQSPLLYDNVLSAIQTQNPTFTPSALRVQPQLILHDYFAKLISETSQLPLTLAMAQHQERDPVDLAMIYTQQDSVSGVHTGERSLNGSDGDGVQEATSLLDRSRLAIMLGEPGAGKTTFVQYVALCMAKRYRREAYGEVTDSFQTWLDKEYVPIVLPLRLLSFGKLRGVTTDMVWSWLDEHYGKRITTLLRAKASQGRCIWLLDALDEMIAGSEDQAFSDGVQLVGNLIDAYPACHYLITCRTADYHLRQSRLWNTQPWRERLKDKPWQIATLRPFSRTRQKTCVQNYLKVLRPVDEPTLHEEIFSLIIQQPDLASLAGNPLMLAMIVLVYTSEAHLPADRTSLYDRCITLLLYRWRVPPVDVQLRDRLGLSEWTSTDTFHLLELLGYAAHERQKGQSHHHAAHLTERDAIQAIRGYFESFLNTPNEQRIIGWATDACDLLSTLSNGIFQIDGTQGYRFLHRTFQEYLAARRLAADDWPGGEGFVARAMRHLQLGAHWDDTVVLTGTYLIHTNRSRLVAEFVQTLLDTSSSQQVGAQRHIILAAKLVLAIRQDRLKRLPQHSSLWRLVADALKSLVTAAQGTLSVSERLEAATLLAQIDDDRPGVLMLIPDWQEIAAGSAIIGSDPDNPASYDAVAGLEPTTLVYETPQRISTLPIYWISRYPVTNTQWRIFLENPNGYIQPAWWSASGLAWRKSTGQERIVPAFWDDSRLNGANQPVVGINWHEAIAFCAWLSEQLHYTVRLPSEEEWEKAARGADGRVYPWGNSWREEHANTQESALGQTSPVGMFGQNDFVYELADMAGNVREWTASPWERQPAAKRSRRSNLSSDGAISEIAVRGGAWNLPREFARGAARNPNDPAARENDLGFRIATDELLHGD